MVPIRNGKHYPRAVCKLIARRNVENRAGTPNVLALQQLTIERAGRRTLAILNARLRKTRKSVGVTVETAANTFGLALNSWIAANPVADCSPYVAGPSSMSRPNMAFSMPRIILDRGADVDARAEVDTNGVGGQTPIFHSLTHFYRVNPEVAHIYHPRYMLFSSQA